VYPDERVVRLVTFEFVPIRVHVHDTDDVYARLSQRLHVQWTPTVLVLDEDGVERHRVEGFLPVDDFLAHLKLGLAKIGFQRGLFDEAERRFRKVVEEHPQSEPAPEALYWVGVSRYKGKGDASALAETARAFTTRYTDSAWAKKASVWRAA
jgi:Tetratricopeptide repeat